MQNYKEELKTAIVVGAQLYEHGSQNRSEAKIALESQNYAPLTNAIGSLWRNQQTNV